MKRNSKEPCFHNINFIGCPGPLVLFLPYKKGALASALFSADCFSFEGIVCGSFHHRPCPGDRVFPIDLAGLQETVFLLENSFIVGEGLEWIMDQKENSMSRLL